jgi:hypothetical protein
MDQRKRKYQAIPKTYFRTIPTPPHISGICTSLAIHQFASNQSCRVLYSGEYDKNIKGLRSRDLEVSSKLFAHTDPGP